MKSVRNIKVRYVEHVEGDLTNIRLKSAQLYWQTLSDCAKDNQYIP